VPSRDLVLAKTGADRVDTISTLSTVIASFSPSILFTTTDLNCAEIDQHTLLAATAIARTVKSPNEIDCLRKAATITGQAIINLLTELHWRPGLTERDIEARFRLHATLLGCPNPAFITNVSAGPNTCYLHYAACTSEVKQNDLILIDCGVFYQHYAGDITRTFPANGKFSDDQAAVYGALLDLQKSLITHVRPGVKWSVLSTEMNQGTFAIIARLGLVPADLPFNDKITNFFLPHGLSHHIGCNVHDLCLYAAPKSKIKDSAERVRVLAPGHVISIEPGIYFHPTKIAELNPSVEPWDKVNLELVKRFAETVGGIRIEDDVLVTESGCEVLSGGCPKEIAEIEALLAA
jgi:Xaa-Pro aminopeptidase